MVQAIRTPDFSRLTKRYLFLLLVMAFIPAMSMLSFWAQGGGLGCFSPLPQTFADLSTWFPLLAWFGNTLERSGDVIRKDVTLKFAAKEALGVAVVGVLVAWALLSLARWVLA